MDLHRTIQRSSLGLTLALAGAVASAILPACSSSHDTNATAGSGGGGNSDAGIGGDTHSGTGGGSDGGPTVQPGLSKVGTGEYETYYLVDGTIYGYGGGAGLLGQGSYQGLCIPPRPIDTPKGLRFIDVQGGLHQSMAVDENHHVWTWGDTSAGLSGSGKSGGDPNVPFMITQDSKGMPFDGAVAVAPVTKFDAALKLDGTVWVWGDCSGGVTGDGTMGGVVEAPTQVPIPLPAGVKITKISAANGVLALASDGSVWAWGPAEGGILGTGNTKDGTVPRKVVNLPANIVDIAAGGASFNYALTADGELFGWGYRDGYLGFGLDPKDPQTEPTPVSLKALLNLQAPVKSVVADSLTTHVILTDGTLWGWGDAACGGIGDGEEPDWSKAASPYAWDFMAYDMMIKKPVQIAPGVKNFTKIFANTAYDFYVYAQTADGTLYSWGRNKTGTLGNGVYPKAANGNVGTSSDMAAKYPNSWDVPLATIVTPMTVMPKGENSPYCVANPMAPSCF